MQCSPDRRFRRRTGTAGENLASMSRAPMLAVPSDRGHRAAQASLLPCHLGMPFSTESSELPPTGADPDRSAPLNQGLKNTGHLPVTI